MNNYRKLVMASIATSLLVPASVQATNGYFLIGFGAKSRGMGGVGVAYAQDAFAAAANPAGITSVGSRGDIGGEFFNPPRRAGGGAADPSFPTEFQFAADAESGSNLFLIPSMAMTYKFNRKLSVGFAAIGAGSNTRFAYDDNFFSLTGKPPGETWGTLGVNLMQMQMLMTGAYKLNKTHSVGASLVGAVQTFRAYGIGNFGGIFNFSTDIDKLTNNGNDWSYGGGIRLGWTGTFLKERLTLGANYSSRVYMTEFDKYSGLFAEQGDFDIPSNYAIGFAVKATDKINITGDVQRIRYDEIKSINNPHPTSSLNDLCTRPIGVDPSQCSTGIDPVPASRAMGSDDGFGFGWTAMTVYKLGVDYKYNSNWTFRAGYNYGKSPIPDSQLLFSMIAPAVIEKHATIGLTYSPNDNIEWSANYTHGFKNAQVCAVNDGCTTMVTQQPGTFVAAELEIRALGAQFSYKF